MGLFSFLGLGGDTQVTTAQTSSTNVKVAVSPQIYTRLDTTPIGEAVGRSFEAGSDILAQSHEAFGKEVGQSLQYLGSSQLALTSAAERQTQTEAEKTLVEQQNFAWIKQTVEKSGKFLLIGGAILVMYLLSRIKLN